VTSLRPGGRRRGTGPRDRPAAPRGRPAQSAGVRGAGDNRFHGTHRPWTGVAPLDAVRAVRAHPGRALLLCWPPFDDDSVSYAPLRAYLGDVLLYVGDVPGPDGLTGATGTTRLHRELALNWTQAEQSALPNWPGLGDRLVVFRGNVVRRRLAQRDRCPGCGRYLPTGVIGRCDRCFRRHPPAMALRVNGHRVEYPAAVVAGRPSGIARGPAPRFRAQPLPAIADGLMLPGAYGPEKRAIIGKMTENRIEVALAEDDVLLREGLASLLEHSGFDVVGQCADAPLLLALVRERQPELVIVDIRMPPGYSTEGLEAARQIRTEFPDIAILVLSAHIEVEHAIGLLASGQRSGYLLKSRVINVDDFVDTLRRLVRGGSVVDPALVAELVSARHAVDQLDVLSRREREVLALMAEGRSNSGIARMLSVTEGTVEKHIGNILMKLRLPETDDMHRRVLAVVTFLNAL
jgi:DNA-binding NarL/FixJ family response regulator